MSVTRINENRSVKMMGDMTERWDIWDIKMGTRGNRILCWDPYKESKSAASDGLLYSVK